MNELQKRLAKIDSEIADAKVSKDKQKRRIKIKRSHEGDTRNNEAALKSTEDGIIASESERKALATQLHNLEADKD